ncbi:class I SAM-dependent methyltransferase [Marinicella sp. W31]|uniref:class I SAM-dependent methyltransferase n=1 Tax=Marinicella sp. W31 TaxID=3023713 RepID=UPI003756D5B0
MTKTQLELKGQIEEIHKNIENSPISQSSLKNIRKTLMAFNHDPFMQSYLEDSMVFLEKHVRIYIRLQKQNNQQRLPIIRKKIDRVLRALQQRLHFLKYWFDRDNSTVDAIKNKTIPATSIKPFVRYSAEKYDAFYQQQNLELKEKLKTRTYKDQRHKSHIPIGIKNDLTHLFRKTGVVALVETLMGVISSSTQKGSYKWLDIGCGKGFITNAVDSTKYSETEWHISGCDLQESRIEMAQKRAAADRTYFAQDAFVLMRELEQKGQHYDLVSMCEFCEHLEDPFDFIKKVAASDAQMMLIATPLEQNINRHFNHEPDKTHLWGFSRQSMEAMIKQTDMEMLYCNETRIGDYLRGLDWLTVVAVKPELKALIAENFDIDL